MLLKSQVYDIFMILFIIFYTLFVLVQFGIDAEPWFQDHKQKIYYAELSVLGVFVIEIAAHLYAFGKLFLKDPWNIADIIVIAISIAFVLVDLTQNTSSSSSSTSNSSSSSSSTG